MPPLLKNTTKKSEETRNKLNMMKDLPTVMKKMLTTPTEDKPDMMKLK
jgi:hypothetical protein